MDNVDTQDVQMDNVDTQTDVVDAGQDVVASSLNWKQGLTPDLRDAPGMHRFEDGEVGLNNLVESYNQLQKLMGHEKVPVPKGDDDIDGWNQFSKALGIPDKAEEYGLHDAEVPEQLKSMAVGKQEFAELVHSHKLTPSQAKGLWDAYNKMTAEGYDRAMQAQEAKMTETINQLKGTWGDAYDTNIELGQMVINKFADDQDMNDYVTASLASSPLGAKFLAKIGNEFAENKIGTFNVKRFSLAPEQANDEIQKIIRDPNHPYNDPNAPDGEHQSAVDYVNSLYAAVSRGKG